MADSVEAGVREALVGLPEKMTRWELCAQVRARLSAALGLDPQHVVCTWVLDTVHVDIPTRIHYLKHVQSISRVVEEAVSRVNVSDPVPLTDDEHAQLVRKLRDGT